MSELEVISRDDAHAKGLTMYYTGEPCKRGHNSPRYTINGSCRDCTYRRRPPGAPTSNPNTRLLSIAFPGQSPTANEVTFAMAVYQTAIVDVMRQYRALIAAGYTYEQILALVYPESTRFLVARDALGNGALPARPVLVIPEHMRCSHPLMRAPADRIDPLTGLSVLKDADGVEQYRPDPFK